MKIYSITGWWNQPGFEALTLIRGQAAIATFDNAHLFTGVLVVDDDGRIDPVFSVLHDKNGPAKLDLGTLNIHKGEIFFLKCYHRRSDTIDYSATLNKTTDCWEGTFTGAMVGEGTTKFILKELPDALFVDDLTNKLKLGY